MTKILAKYVDFSKGESGWVDKSKLLPGYFTGEQVVCFRDGSVGPRSGVLDLTSTASIPAGTLFNMGYVNITGANPEWVFVHKGTKIAAVPVYDNAGNVLTGQAWVQSAASFAATPVSGISDFIFHEPGTLFITLSGDKTYKVDFFTTPGTPVLTAIAVSPGGRCIEQFGAFMCVANVAGNPNRVFFSAKGDPSTWPPANFFDLGFTGTSVPNILAMRALRDMLLVWTNTGELFIVTAPGGNLLQTGGPNIREYLYGDQTTGPGSPDSVVRARDGNVWWTRREELPYQQDQTVDAPSALPVSFDGAKRTDDLQRGGYLRQPSFSIERRSLTTGWPGRSDGSVCLADQSGRVLAKRNDAWSRHHLTGLLTTHIACGLRGDAFGLDAATGAKIMAWQFDLERPPWSFAGSAGAKIPYDANDIGAAYVPLAWFATPELRTPDYELLEVSRVEVLFTAWDTRDATNSHLECFIQQYDRTDAVETQSAAATDVPPDSAVTGSVPPGLVGLSNTTIGTQAVFDAATPAKPVRYRVAFHANLDMLPASGIRVLLRNLRGVSINEIAVFGDTKPVQRP